jgi:hypothetical protein
LTEEAAESENKEDSIDRFSLFHIIMAISSYDTRDRIQDYCSFLNVSFNFFIGLPHRRDI